MKIVGATPLAVWHEWTRAIDGAAMIGHHEC